MLKIYLETSVFNFCVDASRGEAHKCAVMLFKAIGKGKYKGYTSNAVLEELFDDRTTKGEQMSNLVGKYSIIVLPTTEKAKQLADIYVAQGVIPERFKTDGLHLAIAAVNKLDMIASKNCQHIVKQKTKIMTAEINKKHGFKAIEILKPEEIIQL